MFRNSILLIVTLPLFLFSNCKNAGVTNKEPINKEQPQTDIIAFTTLLSDGHSNFTEATQKVITTQEELNQIFAKVNSTRMPGIPVPEVDFTEYEVFFYAVGEISHGTPGLQFAEIIKTDEQLIARLKEQKQDDSGMVTTVMSQPAVMVKYKKQGLPVVVKTAN